MEVHRKEIIFWGGKKDRGKGKIADEEEIQLKMQIRKQNINSDKSTNDETERKREQTHVKREAANQG